MGVFVLTESFRFKYLSWCLPHHYPLMLTNFVIHISENFEFLYTGFIALPTAMTSHVGRLSQKGKSIMWMLYLFKILILCSLLNFLH